MITIRAEYALHLAKFQSKPSDHRYYLEGFNIQSIKDGGATVVATQGHILGAFWDCVAILEPETDVIVRLSAEMLKACKAQKKDNVKRFLNIDGARAWVVLSDTHANASSAELDGIYTQAMQHDCLVDGTFPDWKRVVPDMGDYKPAAFQPDYLAAFKLDGGTVHIHAQGKKAAIVRNSGFPEFLGVIMPVTSEMGMRVPSWAR